MPATSRATLRNTARSWGASSDSDTVSDTRRPSRKAAARIRQRNRTSHPKQSRRLASTLGELGYTQELHRGIGGYAAFASGFSFVSILTTVFAFFPLGFSLGGPGFFWTWPIVFVCQFCVCLIFAELSGKFPVAGAIYQWSRRLAGNAVGWFAGWFMLIGYIVSIAALAIAMQTVLPPIWNGFQIIGDDMDPLSISGAENGIVLGSITIVLCTIISAAGVRFMGRITVTGVTIEIIGVFLTSAQCSSTPAAVRSRRWPTPATTAPDWATCPHSWPRC
jgi:hypothetical protein